MDNQMQKAIFPAALSAVGGLVLSFSLVVMTPQSAGAVPASVAAPQLNGAVVSDYVTKVHDDDWHSRWRSHNRHYSHERWEHGWGGYYHNRWRSHHRWGSEGYHYHGYYHSRWRSHHRWGSEY